MCVFIHTFFENTNAPSLKGLNSSDIACWVLFYFNNNPQPRTHGLQWKNRNSNQIEFFLAKFGSFLKTLLKHSNLAPNYLNMHDNARHERPTYPCVDCQPTMRFYTAKINDLQSKLNSMEEECEMWKKKCVYWEQQCNTHFTSDNFSCG
jgi:hypothetical protein